MLGSILSASNFFTNAMLDQSTTIDLPSLTGILIVVSLFITWFKGVDPLLDAIPTVGFSDPILSYFSAFRLIFGNGAAMLNEGYEKHKPGLFKVAILKRWVVVPSGSELIEDVRKATDDMLSINEPLREFTQTDYTLKFLNIDDHYHRGVIRSKLTRNIPTLFDQIHDELVGAVRDCIPTVGQEWVKVSILPTMQRMICRISGRVFVGAPLCRNRDYQTLASNSAVDIFNSALIIALSPKPLKPIVARIVSNLPSYIRQTGEFIRPMVEERFAKMDQFGETWDDAPSDMLMWLMSEAKGAERSLDGLARRVVLLNFASIHTTASTFTQVLYRLLANPEYIEPLRQEVNAVIAEQGWTKAGIDKMLKIDSFIKETQRVDVLGILGVARVALRPFTFSNGVTIPAGTLVSHPLRAVHTDGEIYPNPGEFDGFRFLKLRDEEGDAMVSKHQVVSTSSEHLAFGVGRHACPGRFFAACEVKALIAYILITYDVKFEDGKGTPSEHHRGPFCFPGNTTLLFRKRQE